MLTLKRMMQLPRSAPSLPLALRVALVAAPALLSASPSQAAIQVPFTGFTGAFAPANWTPNNQGSGTSSVTPTTMTLNVGGSTGGRGQQLINLDAVLNAVKPQGTTGFIGGTYSFTWNWNFTDVAIGTSFPFGDVNNIGAIDNLAIYAGPPLNPFSPSSYDVTGVHTGTVSAGNVFGFGILNTNPAAWQTGSATGTISNFTFLANYAEVPGPLPIAGAAAAYAWSRKLRRRLKTAQSPA